MTRHRRNLLLLATVGLSLCLLVVVLRKMANEPSTPDRVLPPDDGRPEGREVNGGSPRASPETAGDAPVREALDRTLLDIGSALLSDDRALLLNNLRDLRALLLLHPSLTADLGELLLDAGLGIDLRRALAAILGSLPGTEAKLILLRALEQGVEPAAVRRAIVFALGMPGTDEGDIFERDEQPYAVEIAPGVVVFVLGEIEIDAVRTALAKLLSGEDAAEVRLAAARTLRDSTAHPEIREALLTRLGKEPDDEIRGEAAAALCRWTQDRPTLEPERTRVVGRVLDVLPDAGEVTLFRVLAPLSSTPMTEAEDQRIRSLAGSSNPDIRSYVMDMLGRRLVERQSRVADVLPSLTGTLNTDPDPAVREAAAMALRTVAREPEATRALILALRQDSHWEVRAAAARTLRRANDLGEVEDALNDAMDHDQQEEVRTTAERSLMRNR